MRLASFTIQVLVHMTSLQRSLLWSCLPRHGPLGLLVVPSTALFLTHSILMCICHLSTLPLKCLLNQSTDLLHRIRPTISIASTGTELVTVKNYLLNNYQVNIGLHCLGKVAAKLCFSPRTWSAPNGWSFFWMFLLPLYTSQNSIQCHWNLAVSSTIYLLSIRYVQRIGLGITWSHRWHTPIQQRRAQTRTLWQHS